MNNDENDNNVGGPSNRINFNLWLFFNYIRELIIKRRRVNQIVSIMAIITPQGSEIVLRVASKNAGKIKKGN